MTHNARVLASTIGGILCVYLIIEEAFSQHISDAILCLILSRALKLLHTHMQASIGCWSSATLALRGLLLAEAASFERWCEIRS